MKHRYPTWALAIAAMGVVHPAFPQARNANWVSNCWVSFSPAGPEVAPLPPNGVQSQLCISDPNGQLFLIKGGNYIRDINFEPIANHPPFETWLVNLDGGNGIFIPVPDHPERMFLFFLRWDVDPTLRKYGWLEIGPDAPGGQLRMTDAGPQFFMENPARKCTALPHANGEDYWFVSQAGGTNEVHAFRIGDLGVEEGPVVSPGGTVINEQNYTGFMVASVQGDRLIVQTHYNVSGLTETPAFDLYSFDAGTGAAVLQHTFVGLVGHRWGAEFSPSGRFLYVLREGWVEGTAILRHTLYQYDLYQSDVEASRVVIDTHDMTMGGTGSSWNNLCLAPDGRIYINRYPTSAFAIIHAPDEAAPDCNYAEDGWLLDGCIAGVPQPLKRYHDDLGLGMGTGPTTTMGIFPNPLNDHAVFTWPGEGPVRVQWLDVQGRMVQQVRTTPQNGQVELDARSLAVGVYLLRVTPMDGVVPITQRVVVAR
jgi:hypothetical protein